MRSEAEMDDDLCLDDKFDEIISLSAFSLLPSPLRQDSSLFSLMFSIKSEYGR